MQKHKIQIKVPPSGGGKTEVDMIKLPESELEVMLILWEKNGEEMSVNEVWEALNGQKKITMGALHSYLNRLEEKGYAALDCKGICGVSEGGKIQNAPPAREKGGLQGAGGKRRLLGRFFRRLRAGNL